LNYKEHDYIFFCAKADFSGYHSFSKTFAQHVSNATAYQRALNRMKIFR
ncbi:MAG: endolytic transglycosylase MltG, partial [Prevotellaceae bacterium]|nr:endolytic transglycosylase MltG [Prevotellaceae bacterium]